MTMEENNTVPFTPGPWVIENGCVIADQKSGVRPKVATVHATYMHVSFAERNANACLIAAAPELYAALELVWEAYGFDPSIDSSIWRTVQCALAKAVSNANPQT